jgi:membrane associated rhomboid family serine protease
MRVVTYIILGILLLVFFTVNNYSTNVEVIDYQLRSFYHADMQHLIANSISLFALSFMEEVIGWKMFFFAILFIWVVSSLLLYIIHRIFPSRKVYTVGFSGVIFGLIVVYYSVLNQSPGVSILGLAISILPQLTMIGISFEGHLAGIIAGIIFILLFPTKKKLIR